MGLEVVHVRTVPMHVRSDRMADSVVQVGSVSRSLQYITGRFVHFPAGEFLAACNRRFHFIDAGVPGSADNLENLANAVWQGFSYIANPTDVVVDGARRVFLAPDIQQENVSFSDWLETLCGRE